MAEVAVPLTSRQVIVISEPAGRETRIDGRREDYASGIAAPRRQALYAGPHIPAPQRSKSARRRGSSQAFQRRGREGVDAAGCDCRAAGQ